MPNETGFHLRENQVHRRSRSKKLYPQTARPGERLISRLGLAISDDKLLRWIKGLEGV
jgi:hypothetical protein